jgi:hypothetical protein
MPVFARLLSIHVSDIRIIFDDLEGLEVTLRDFRLGTQVIFTDQPACEANLADSPDLAMSPSPNLVSLPTSPAMPMKQPPRDYPLYSPGGNDMSPPDSPINYFQKFALPNSSTEEVATMLTSERKVSRLSDARRRASVMGGSCHDQSDTFSPVY